MKNTDPLITKEAIYNASHKEVWAALTEHEALTKWFFPQIPEFKAEVGFSTAFDVKAPSRIFRHLWTLTEVEMPHRITYKWRYANCAGLGYVTFELADMGKGKTRCRLTNSVVKSFSDNYPEFKRESAVAGWQYFIGEALKNYLEK